MKVCRSFNPDAIKFLSGSTSDLETREVSVRILLNAGFFSESEIILCMSPDEYESFIMNALFDSEPN